MPQNKKMNGLAAAFAIFLGAAFLAAVVILPKTPSPEISAGETPVLRPLTD